MYIYNYIENDDVRKLCKKLNVEFSAEEKSAIIMNSKKNLKDKKSALRELKKECSINLAYQIDLWLNYKQQIINNVANAKEGCVFCLFVDGSAEKFFTDYEVAEKYLKKYAKTHQAEDGYVIESEALISDLKQIKEDAKKKNRVLFDTKGEVTDAECQAIDHQYLTTIYGKRMDTVYVDFPNPYKEYDVVNYGDGQEIIAPETEENKNVVEKIVKQVIGKKGYTERFIPVYRVVKDGDEYKKVIGAVELLNVYKAKKEDITAKSRFTLKQLRKLSKN